MLQTAQELIRRTAIKSGLTDKQIDELIKVDKIHEFDIELKNGKKYKAYRVQHNNKLGPYKGGIRFHHDVNLEETRALATLMSLKTSAVGLPLGGGKGGVAVNPKDLSEDELEELSRKYSKALKEHIGPDKDVPAPDVNTDSKIIDWMVDEFEHETGDKSKASFTGKSIANGGSLGRESATGRGGVYAFDKLLQLEGNTNKNLTYAVQGFGNVGSFFSLIEFEQNPSWKMLSATDSSGGIYDVAGLNPAEIDNYKRLGGRLADYKNGQTISNDELIGLEVDVLILAALGDAVNESNYKNIKAKYIIELANGPVSEKAHDELTKNDVIILPDIIANSGGVIVSYLEWLQNKNDEKWDETKVNHKLKEYIDQSVKSTYDLVQKENLSLKEASFTLAIKRLVK